MPLKSFPTPHSTLRGCPTCRARASSATASRRCATWHARLACAQRGAWLGLPWACLPTTSQLPCCPTAARCLPLPAPALPCPQELWVDPLTGLPTLRHDLHIDRGMSFEAAAARLAHERSGPDDRSGFRASRRPMFGRTMPLLALQKPGQHNIFTVCRPTTGALGVCSCRCGTAWPEGGGALSAELPQLSAAPPRLPLPPLAAGPSYFDMVRQAAAVPAVPAEWPSASASALSSTAPPTLPSHACHAPQELDELHSKYEPISGACLAAAQSCSCGLACGLQENRRLPRERPTSPSPCLPAPTWSMAALQRRPRARRGRRSMRPRCTPACTARTARRGPSARWVRALRLCLAPGCAYAPCTLPHSPLLPRPACPAGGPPPDRRHDPVGLSRAHLGQVRDGVCCARDGACCASTALPMHLIEALPRRLHHSPGPVGAGTCHHPGPHARSLERVLGRHEMELSKSDRALRIVRVDFGDGSLPLIGTWGHPGALGWRRQVHTLAGR